MDFVDLQPGTRVNVVPADGDSGSAYEAMVRSVSEDAIRLTMPERNDEFLRVDAGAPITLITSMHGQVYRVTTRVRLIETAPVEGLVVEPPLDAEKDERRSFYRLLTRIVPRQAALVEAGGIDAPLEQSVILDISGGGLQMQSTSPMDPGARVHLIFAIEGDPLELEVSMDVLTVHAPTRTGRVYRVHGRFAGMPRSEIERIVRYIYRQQVALRRKGVL